MVEVRWTAQAADDLEAITQFIALDSIHHASVFAADTLATLEKIACFPASGRIVREFNEPSIREAIHGNYRIVYRTRPEVIEVLTIRHCARLLERDGVKRD